MSTEKVSRFKMLKNTITANPAIVTSLKIVAIILMASFLIWDALGAEATQKDGPQKLATPESVDGFLKEIGDTGRPITPRLKKGGIEARDLDLVLDARMPKIDGACDLAVAYEVLKIAYLARAKIEGGERIIRDFARKLAEIDTSTSAAITPRCRTELKAFGIAVTRTFLGGSWDPVLKETQPPQPKTEPKPETPAPRSSRAP